MGKSSKRKLKWKNLENNKEPEKEKEEEGAKQASKKQRLKNNMDLKIAHKGSG